MRGCSKLKKIILFDTSSGSYNKGDEIIMLGVREGLKSILENAFVTTLPTHTPIFHFYQTLNLNQNVKLLKQADYKFICGTNLLYTNMLRPWPLWNINLFNSKPLNECILVGVGNGINSKKINYYTRLLYKSVLSKKYIHSVRDNSTKFMLESMGFKAINTGCPTLWGITKELCKKIPTKKSNNVIFTLTDYRRDIKKDQKLIDILNRNYDNVYFWPQGSEDLDYMRSFNNTAKIIVVNPSVQAFSNILNNEDIDYIGTRLHAGIFSIKHRKRSIIISVDHRARNMGKDFNLNVVERKNISDLESIIWSEFVTNVNVDHERINLWLNQFENNRQ